jgi:hypothetical protein
VSASTALPLVAPEALLASEEIDSVTLDSIADEAGVAAYLKVTAPVSLSAVRGAFRTIEVETSTYIVGSIQVGEYPSSEDPHVYVDTDGWMMAYYLAHEPAAKLFDWRAYHDGGRTTLRTMLEAALLRMTAEASKPYPGATHYDFRYPNATRLMLIAKWDDYYGRTRTFDVILPSDLAYSERSWSLTSSSMTAQLYLNDVLIASCSGWQTVQGTLGAATLGPDQLHVFEVNYTNSGNYAYGGLALVYGE